jgi:hypothetical protein
MFTACRSSLAVHLHTHNIHIYFTAACTDFPHTVTVHVAALSNYCCAMNKLIYTTAATVYPAEMLHFYNSVPF